MFSDATNFFLAVLKQLSSAIPWHNNCFIAVRKNINLGKNLALRENVLSQYQEKYSCHEKYFLWEIKMVGSSQGRVDK